MNRWFSRVLVMLLLGLAANILVAWTCVLVHGNSFGLWNPHHNPRHEDPLVIMVTERFGHTIISGCGRSGTLLGDHGSKVAIYEGKVWWPSEAVDIRNRGSYAVAAGWPMPSLSAWCSSEVEPDRPGASDMKVPYIYVYHTGFAWETSLFPKPPPGDFLRTIPPIFPFKPLWSGLAINSLLYALLLGCCIFAPGALKRRLRASRGRCTRCAYPMGPFTTCPECGSPAYVRETSRT